MKGTNSKADDKRFAWTLAIFATALAVRLVHVWQIRASPFFSVLMGDSHGYDDWAQRIAGGDWIGRGLLSGAAVSVSARRHLRDRGPEPPARPRHPGDHRLGVVRAARPRRVAAVFAARRPSTSSGRP